MAPDRGCDRIDMSSAMRTPELVRRKCLAPPRPTWPAAQPSNEEDYRRGAAHPEELVGGVADVFTMIANRGEESDGCREAARDAAMHARVADSLAMCGFHIEDGFLDPAERAAWQALMLERAGRLVPARVGRGGNERSDESVRGDRIMWLEPGDPAQPTFELFARLHALRAALNRALMTGLVEVQAHLACYAPGARYAAHLDRFRDHDTRAISLVLYLNESWRSRDGGALRLHDGPGVDSTAREILPLAGRLVVFRSEHCLHEVLPAVRERWSIAAWFARRSARVA